MSKNTKSKDGSQEMKMDNFVFSMEINLIVEDVIDGGIPNIVQKPLHGHVYLLSLIHPAFIRPHLQHVSGSPEHTQCGVFTLVLAVYRADGIVRFLYLALLAEGKYILYSHSRKGLEGEVRFAGPVGINRHVGNRC